MDLSPVCIFGNEFEDFAWIKATNNLFLGWALMVLLGLGEIVSVGLG